MGKQQKSQPATRISQRLAKQPTLTQSTLPPELWTTIFAYLLAPDLCAAKSVCRFWRDIVSTTPLRALCDFDDDGFDQPRSHCVTVENESIRVYIGLRTIKPEGLNYFLVPGLTPLMYITMERLFGIWETMPSDYPLFDTIRQLVSDRCGLNVTLVLTPSFLKPSRFPTRFGIPVYADSETVERTLTAEHDAISLAISLATREYFSAITTLSIVELGDQPKFKNALALMPNIDCVIVYMYAMDNLDFGLDTLPNLRTLEISGSTIDRNLLRYIAKLRHLEDCN